MKRIYSLLILSAALLLQAPVALAKLKVIDLPIAPANTQYAIRYTKTPRTAGVFFLNSLIR